MKPEQQRVTVRLRCVELPGRSFDGKADIKVGAQKGDTVVDDVFGDAKQASFDFELRVERNAKTGKPNFLGPYAHGKPTERFLYLCWGQRIGGAWHGFRRAKIHLSHLDWPTVETAIAASRPIEAVLKLTDKKGGPLCASVKGDQIGWRR
jgi:Family of unknown function (DUF5990)